jgi:chemotaxis signal transduction protein
MIAAEGEALIIRAGGVRFALPMDRIAEVRAYTPETPVPGTPPAIRGIVERNGVPVHVLDPVRRMFDSSATLGSRACIIFFDQVAGHGAAAMVVEEVERMVERPSSEAVSLLDIDALFAIDPPGGG